MAAYLYSLAFDSCRLGPAHGLLFFFTEDFFCYSRARIDTEYFFHESTLLYFFLTRSYCVCETQKSIDSFDVM